MRFSRSNPGVIQQTGMRLPLVVHGVTLLSTPSGCCVVPGFSGAPWAARARAESPNPKRRHGIDRLRAAERILEGAVVFMVAPGDRRSKFTVPEARPTQRFSSTVTSACLRTGHGTPQRWTA